jgi:hypothetical protein
MIPAPHTHDLQGDVKGSSSRARGSGAHERSGGTPGRSHNCQGCGKDFVRGGIQTARVSVCPRCVREGQTSWRERLPKLGPALPAKPLDDTWFAEHGVAPEVRDARGYVAYHAGDPLVERILDAYVNARKRSGFVRRVVAQQPGILFYKHAPPFLGIPQPTPQLRPANPVHTGATTFHPAHEPGAHWKTGNPMWCDPVNGDCSVPHASRPEPAKYVFVGDAKHLDVNPLAVHKIRRAERVFFGIEGSIKADAMLSAGEAVFSVAAVGLWDAPELRLFAARYLRRKRIYIVPDADWFDNPQVITHALLCRTFLRNGLGLEAEIASPPVAWWHERAAAGYKHDKGIDDFLAQRGRMDELDVVVRDPPPNLAAWLWTQDQAARIDRKRRNARLLEGLALHAGRDGRVAYLGLRKCARVMGINGNTGRPYSHVAARRALQDLHEMGAFAVEDGSLETILQTWREFQPGAGWIDRYGGMDFADRPTLTLKEDLRVNYTDPVPLAQYEQPFTLAARPRYGRSHRQARR